MTWPFENDTSAITKKLAKKSLQSEKRRNLMVVIAVALAAFLICFTGIVSTSLTQMQRNQVVDTYEAVWMFLFAHIRQSAAQEKLLKPGPKWLIMLFPTLAVKKKKAKKSQIGRAHV